MTLVTTNSQDAILSELETQSKILDRVMKMPHYQKMGADGVSLIVAKARSLNLDPLYALNGALFNVRGKIGMAAETMAAMIREKGHSIIKDSKSNNNVCILHGKRADNGDTWTVSFSIDDAKRAGIYQNMWEKYPSVMCYNRAMSLLARQLFADIIKGCGYNNDELHEIAKNNKFESPREPELVQFEEIKEEKPRPLPITQTQAQELQLGFVNCSPEYQDTLFKSFSTMNPQVNSFNELPAHLYDRVKTAINKNATEYQLSLTPKEEVLEVVNA